jgi:hypothetical protein
VDPSGTNWYFADDTDGDGNVTYSPLATTYWYADIQQWSTDAYMSQWCGGALDVVQGLIQTFRMTNYDRLSKIAVCFHKDSGSVNPNAKLRLIIYGSLEDAKNNYYPQYTNDVYASSLPVGNTWVEFSLNIENMVLIGPSANDYAFLIYCTDSPNQCKPWLGYRSGWPGQTWLKKWPGPWYQNMDDLSPNARLSFVTYAKDQPPYGVQLQTVTTGDLFEGSPIEFKATSYRYAWDHVRASFSWDGGTTWTAWSSEFDPQRDQWGYATHTFGTAGTYTIKAKTKNTTYGLESTDIATKQITIQTINHAPGQPTPPERITPGSTYVVNKDYQFRTKATDPDNDNISYTFNWGGFETSNVTGLVKSGDYAYAWHRWTTAGDYNLFTKPTDEHSLAGPLSDWVNIFVFPGSPIVSTSDASSVQSTSATFNGYLFKDGGWPCNGHFLWGKTTSYGSTTSNVNNLLSSNTYSSTVYYLEQCKVYHFKAEVIQQDPYSNSSQGADVVILTQPDGLNVFTATKINSSLISLHWEKPAMCTGAFIQYRIDSGSWNNLGTGYYSGSSGDINHVVSLSGIYTYRAWGYAEDAGIKSDGTANKPFSSYYLERSVSIYRPPTLSTTDASNVQQTTATLNGYLTDDGNPDDGCTVIFDYGQSLSYGNATSGQLITTPPAQAFSANIINLLKGKVYHFRARAYHSDGSSTATDKTLLTRPDNVTNFTATPITPHIVNLTWTNNQGGEGAYVEYKIDSPPSPWNVGSATAVEGGDNGRVRTQFLHTGLIGNRTYYYKAWAYANDSGIRSDGSAPYPYSSIGQTFNVTTISHPVITLYPATGITNETAILHALLNDSGLICTFWFEYGLGNFDNKTSNTTLMNGTIDTQIFNLTASKIYQFRGYGINALGVTITSAVTFTTLPKRPTNLFIPEYGQYIVNLTWTKGIGADYTAIRSAEGNYPTDPFDGRFVYLGNGINVTDTGFSNYANLYYRAWGYNATTGLYSIDYDQVNTSVIDYEVFLPTYLKVGEYIIAWGKIASISGQSVEGFIAKTTVRDINDTTLVGPAYWNCTDGNYQTAISTNLLTAGTYQIGVEFENNIGTKFIFTYRNLLHLSSEVDVGQGNESTAAYIYYTFYDISNGIGLDDNYYKIYISHDTSFSPGDRVKGGKIGVVRGDNVYTGNRYYLEIRDFNDNILPIMQFDNTTLTAYNIGMTYNAYVGFNVTMPEYYVDLGIYLNRLRIKNMNDSTIYITLKRTDGNPGQVVGRFIPPWEETEIFIPDGAYNLIIDYYNNSHPEWGPQITTYPWINSLTITTDLFYWVKGSNLEDVIEVIDREGTWIYYTLFDMNTGSKLGDDFYKLYFSTDTNFTELNRASGGEINAIKNTTIYYKVVDYWNNIIYPYNGSQYANLTIAETKVFLDIGIPLNQFLIKNTNETMAYFRLTNGNFTDQANNTWYNKWIPSHENSQLFIRSGTYNISIEYYYPNNMTFISFENISNYMIDRDTFFIVLGKNAKVYFNFYMANEGLGLQFETLKIYANGIRLYEKYINCYQGQEMNITIEDYYNNVIYNETFIVSDGYTFKDIPLVVYSYKFSNYKDDYFVIGFKKEGSPLWWEKIACPYETTEFMPSQGNYSIRIYNATLNIAEFNDTVNNSKAYVIRGTNLSDELMLTVNGQNTMYVNFTNNSERQNFTNENFVNLINNLPYRNETIISVLDEFRLPHVMEIPQVSYNYSDVLPPISTIFASIGIDGNIDVTWYSTDESKKSIKEMLYYKIENATDWKQWYDNLSSTGIVKFNSTIETLTEGNVYSFKAIGIDEAGNIENESRYNTCNITYSLTKITGIDTNQVLTDAATNWIFIFVVILIILLLIIIAIIERRKRRPEELSTLEEDAGWPYMPYEGDV